MMKVRLHRLELTCKAKVETVEFSEVSYFYGRIGSGKSSIARLVDYCLGGNLVMTPALQAEFVSALLVLTVGESETLLTRDRESNQVLAQWKTGDEEHHAILPARKAGGVVVPGTKVEVVSDLLFHLSGIAPPKVRRSQIREDSDLQRLSFRNVYRFCYIDQDDIDSSFFELGRNDDTYRRLSSRNVLRFVLGIHQEKVAELEQELEDTRRQRSTAEQGADALENTLLELDAGETSPPAEHVVGLEKTIRGLEEQISKGREGLREFRSHVTDRLRVDGRRLADEMVAIESAIQQVEAISTRDQRHLNELLSLSTKLHRIDGARAVLQGVDYVKCPRCAQTLPDHASGACSVCRQTEPTPGESNAEIEIARTDLKARIEELREAVDLHGKQLKGLANRREHFARQKENVDSSLTGALTEYDSAYLSQVLELEKQKASKLAEIVHWQSLTKVKKRLDIFRGQADESAAKENGIKRDLKAARESAQKDLTNLNELRSLFLDCLVRARLAGFRPDDEVRMEFPWFLPEVRSKESGDLAVTSFATLGSGGKKTLFKACFAIAFHRLAVKVGAFLPTLLVIDSPMKNISERENRTEFEGFYEMLYDLARTELQATQILLIDKEYCEPKSLKGLDLKVRYMTPDEDDNPPLITYYRGK